MTLERTERIARDGMLRGLHPGVQLYVSLAGRSHELKLGDARPGVPVAADTLMLWLSSIKPIAAVAIAKLWEQGLLGLDDRVALHIPEFAANGKEAVTLRHVLTHTGGFRMPIRHWRGQTWDEAIAEVCKGRLEPRWVPGEKAGYHPASSWYLLGELIRRIDGRPFEEYVRDEIFTPLGMADWSIGIAYDKQQALGDRLCTMFDTSSGEPAVDPALNSPHFIAAVRPGANGRGPAAQFARFYEMLLGGGELGGARILRPSTVAEFVRRQRAGMYDHTFKHTLDYGLGFIVDSKQYGAATIPYGYGDHASPATFGHGGSQSSVAFADPEHGLVVALAFNGMPGEASHQERLRLTASAIYEDLGLA